MDYKTYYLEEEKLVGLMVDGHTFCLEGIWPQDEHTSWVTNKQLRVMLRDLKNISKGETDNVEFAPAVRPPAAVQEVVPLRCC